MAVTATAASWQTPRGRLRGLALATVVLPATAVWGADWFVEPSASLRAEYNDNPRLRTENENARSVWGGILDLAAGVGFDTETTEFLLTPKVRLAEYTRESVLDKNDQFVDIDLKHRNSERSELALEGNFTRDTTVTSEVEEGTGRVEDNGRRIRWNANPSWAYAVTPRGTVKFGVDYSDTDYRRNDPGETGLVDYETGRADATYTFRLTERDDISGTLYVSRFETENASPTIDSKTDEYGFQGVYSRALSETLRFSFGAGVRRSDLDFLEQNVGAPASKASDKDTGFLFNTSLENQGERTTWKLLASRSNVATGAGNVLERDEAQASVSHRLMERLTGVLSGRIFRQDTLSDGSTTAGNNARDFARIAAVLRYRLTRNWSLEANYSYTRSKRNIAAKRNIAGLAIRWDGDKKNWFE